MFNRSLFLNGLSTLVGLAFLSPAFAAEVAPFDQAAFDAAKTGGKSVLVEVTAPWCPTCKAQKQVLSELFAKPEFVRLVVFDVDFDSRKDVSRAR
jgi:thiol-disulfide isomerase/thioredoxin